MIARSRFGALLALALVLGVIVPFAVPQSAPPAHAADAANWDPGYIIDDSVFYDSTSMTAGDVQNFLNSQLSSCASGYTCLKDYSTPTQTRPADSYCGAYQGSASESAAVIIDKVARACGINQRVILVMLQKEQGLVTDRAPSSRKYAAAMGQSCPDTPPGCDPAYAGLFYQVYFAARQLQIYRAFPTSFGYRAQRWNNILYSTNSACGTQSVFIQNQATAALYIYTPYVPNAAALANLYGTGDGCSSYGNRNFWRLFTDWFGDPTRYVVDPGFVAYWNGRGGAAGVMGAPNSFSVYVPQNGQGWYQRFQGGTVYGSYSGGLAFIFNGAIAVEYAGYGSATGPLGFPNAEQTCVDGGVCAQSFVNAVITSTPQYGGKAIWGGMTAYWNQTGGLGGTLGAALNQISYVSANGGGGYLQNYQKGIAVQGPGGSLTVPGATGGAWLSLGGASGTLAWPTGAESCSGGVCAQSFQRGSVTTTPQYGSHAIWGSFFDVWNQSGGRDGSLGAALNDIAYYNSPSSGWVQHYQKGIVVQSGAGIFSLSPAFSTAWYGSGGASGWLGWPTSGMTCTSGTCTQAFSGGVLTSSPQYGVRAVVGSFAPWWNAGGGISTLGPALTDLRYVADNGGGWSQHFAAGVAAQPRSGVVSLVSGAVQTTWYAAGGASGWIGWPTGAAACASGACGQSFQNAALTTSPTAGTRVIVGGLGALWAAGAGGGMAAYGPATGDTAYSDASGGGWKQSFSGGQILQARSAQPVWLPNGPIQNAWSFYGAERTWLGWPVGAQTCTSSGCAQTFQYGTATATPSGAVTFTRN